MSGILPFSRAPFMMDFVALAMVAVVPVLIFSIYQIKVRKNYRLHKNIQIITGVVLLVAVVAFEIDVRFISDWKSEMEKSPYYESGLVTKVLWIHLFFAISAFLTWIVTIPLAIKRIPNPPGPSEHSPLHKKLGWISAITMIITAFTGWTFYYMAFVA